MWLHAVHTVGEETEEVHILDIKTTDADIETDILFIYAVDATGVIGLEPDKTKLCVCE